MKLKTRCFFEAAHRLNNYEGKCNRVHGHQWIVDVEVESDKLDKAGMVVDFSEIKNIVGCYDHRLLLEDCEYNRKLFDDKFPEDWVRWTKFSPTCEYIALEIEGAIVNRTGCKVVKVRVYENFKPESYSYCEVGE